MTAVNPRRWRVALPGILAFCILLALYLPMLLRWEEAYVVVHDNLDSEVTYLDVLHRAGLAVSTDPAARIEQVMNGIPRSLYRSGYNLTVVLFWWLPPHGAYLIGGLLAHMVALFGMFHLLVTHFMPERDHRVRAWCVALCFAVIPFYSIYGLTFAAQPLLLSAFLSFRKGLCRWGDLAIVLLFPLTVLNYMVTPFAMAVLGIIGIWDLMRKRSFRPIFWLMLAILGTTMVLVEWGLLRAMFSAQAMVSHRTEWDLPVFGDTGLSASLAKTISLFLHGHYHAGLFFTLPALVAAGIAALIAMRTADTRLILGLVITILLFMAMLPMYPTLLVFAGDSAPLLKYFTFSRFFFLTPVMWALVLALSFRTYGTRSWAGPVVALITIMHVYYAVRNDQEVVDNHRAMRGIQPDRPSFNAYYAPRLFDQIKDRVGAPMNTLRFVSLGFPPNIAQFNGLYTLDSYQNNYELAYKHQFRKIIARELERSLSLRSYFDAWGSRCYLWSSELGKQYNFHKGTDVTLRTIDLDLNAFVAMGGTHILSTVTISGPMAEQLTLLDMFEDEHSAWRIRLYEVDR